MTSKSNAGFTLLELLIAMVIFSFMSILAYSSLASIFKNNTIIEIKEKDLKELKRAMMFIERDMRQIVLRPRREGFGVDEQSPALIAGFDNEGSVEFTKAGGSNPTESVRSSLQRVNYLLRDNVIIRKSWNIVDHVGVEAVQMPLLTNVKVFSLRFFNDKGVFEENWSSSKKLPRAIELTIDHKIWGKIIRLIPTK